MEHLAAFVEVLKSPYNMIAKHHLVNGITAMMVTPSASTCLTKGRLALVKFG